MKAVKAGTFVTTIIEVIANSNVLDRDALQAATEHRRHIADALRAAEAIERDLREMLESN